MKTIVDLFDRIGRALRPAEPVAVLPTPEDFELLMHRFEREYTIAYTACIWKSTWLELVALSEKLYADKGDLAAFYALDHAEELIRSRRIKGIGEDFRKSVDGERSARSKRSLRPTSAWSERAPGWRRLL